MHELTSHVGRDGGKARQATQGLEFYLQFNRERSNIRIHV